jgi:hypothetical protein
MRREQFLSRLKGLTEQDWRSLQPMGLPVRTIHSEVAMQRHWKHARVFVSAAILAGGMVLLADRANAAEVSLTCGDPPFPGGSVTLATHIITPGGQTIADQIKVPIPTADAAEKCALIAAAIPPEFTPKLNGKTLTIFSGYASALWILEDTTFEFNQLSATLSPGGMAKFMEIPTPNPDAAPPAGMTFLISVANSNGSFGFTNFVASDGVTPSGVLLANLLQPFFGPLAFNSNCDPSPPSPTVCSSTASFDPTTVSISWNGNTAQYLANFGLSVQDAAVPEPATLLLVGMSLLALLSWRRLSHRIRLKR